MIMADIFTRPEDSGSRIARPTIRIMVVVIGILVRCGTATAEEPARAFPNNDAFHDVAVVCTISDRTSKLTAVIYIATTSW